MKRMVIGGVITLILVIASFSTPLQAESNKSALLRQNLSSSDNFEFLSDTTPIIATPDWYKKAVYYSVTSAGTVKGGVDEFASQANATLNDARGWSQIDVKFIQVASGGSFTLILAESSYMPNYSQTGCSPDWSCSVGGNIIINDDRWMGATDAWNKAGGNLRDYRHMVINHEVGHWLGHGHEFCGGTGKLAPVMQQQSMDLQGCKFNPWPLPSEVQSTKI